jgi:hypothetical protein
MSHTFIPRSRSKTPVVLCLALVLAGACGDGEHPGHRLSAAERDSTIDAAVRHALDPASLAAEESRMPKFEAYPVADTFPGTPAPVDLESAEGAREFAAVLREAARKGPNFAGHYTAVTWVDNKTPSHRVFAVIDAWTGRVTMGPQDISFGLAYRLDSSLLVTDPIDRWRKEYGPDSTEPAGMFAESHYFNWNGERLVHLDALTIGSDARASAAVNDQVHALMAHP